MAKCPLCSATLDFRTLFQGVRSLKGWGRVACPRCQLELEWEPQNRLIHQRVILLVLLVLAIAVSLTEITLRFEVLAFVIVAGSLIVSASLYFFFSRFRIRERPKSPQAQHS